MKKSTIALALLSTLLTLKPSQARSLFCEDKDNFIYKGISCCSNVIDQKTCIDLINNHVSDEILSAIALTQEEIHGGLHTPGSLPNCHWFALYNMDPQNYSAPKYQEGWLVYDIIEQLSPIARDELKKGDLIYFEEHVKMRDNNFFNNGGKRMSYTQLPPAPSHSAIYLANNFLIQKENVTTEHFSIAPIGVTFEAYEKSLNSNVAVRKGFLKQYFYRL